MVLAVAIANNVYMNGEYVNGFYIGMMVLLLGLGLKAIFNKPEEVKEKNKK